MEDTNTSGRPQVSVLMPARDAAATIEEALGSVLADAALALEVLVVDDGSRDATKRLADRVASRDPRVRVLGSRGRGIVAALETARAAARAPWLARMDADDVCVPARFGPQLTLLRDEPRLAVIGSRATLLGDVDEGMRRYVAWQNQLVTPEQHRAQLFVESPLCHPGVMMRARALDEIGGYREGDFPEDYDLWLRLDARGWAIAKVPMIGVRWRRHAGQATFADPRYGRDRFEAIKTPHLAARVRDVAGARPLYVWGAGRAGKSMARALEAHALSPEGFIDIDPRKREARGRPVRPPAALPRDAFVLIAVAARGARDQVRARLAGEGRVEGRDHLAVR